MADEQMTKFLDGVVGVVEATSFEALCLWNEYRELGKPWRSEPAGLLETVGHVGDMPVCISLNVSEVDGHRLLLLNATSQVVDHRMVDGWLKDNLPRSAFREDGHPNRTNAMNFHNVFRECRKAA